jgi:8-oxo-dGTP pyrophosphatase MutT (NUDIX family)
MNFEPEKFFIGLMDFFSILLPGALLTYLLMDSAGPTILGAVQYKKLSSTPGWVGFLFASYLLGHLIFLLGSWLDEIYDWFRNHTLNAQIEGLAKRGKLSHWMVRVLVWVVFKRESNHAVNRVVRIKEKSLESLRAKHAINAFQWSKATLSAERPASLAVVERFEASSKFFRCLTVVLLIVLLIWPLSGVSRSDGLLIALALLLLSMWRYMEQRFKSTNQAYWSVIALTAQSGKLVLNEAAPLAANLTHAGGVVFRKHLGNAQYLLVEAADDANQWVLPKGHIEESERARATAIREVHEETGVWARIEGDLHAVSYSVNGQLNTVQFYLMKKIGIGLRKEGQRRHRWFSLENAVQQASHLETRELLKRADEQSVKQKATGRKPPNEARIELLRAAEQHRVRER